MSRTFRINQNTLKTIAARQSASSRTRRSDDAAALRLTPVPMATYAARHAGHLGRSTRTTAGSDHRVSAMDRRTRGDGAETLFVATRGGVALPEIDLQHAFITYLHARSRRPGLCFLK